MKRLATILATCTIVEAISSIRPGAQWNLRDSNLEWLDANQDQPTVTEITTAISACRTAETARLAAKAQARIDVKNTSLTQAQRMQALLILLDYDK